MDDTRPKMFVYREAHDDDPFCCETVKVFSSKQKAYRHLEVEVEKHFYMTFEELEDKYGDDYSMTVKPWCVEIPEWNGITHFLVEEVAVEDAA